MINSTSCMFFKLSDCFLIYNRITCDIIFTQNRNQHVFYLAIQNLNTNVKVLYCSVGLSVIS